MMGDAWNPTERQAFDAALAAHLAHTFPAARQEWVENHRRRLLHFPDGCTTTVYEPNFFFCLGTLWTEQELCVRAAAAIAARHQTLERGGVIEDDERRMTNDESEANHDHHDPHALPPQPEPDQRHERRCRAAG